MQVYVAVDISAHGFPIIRVFEQERDASDFIKACAPDDDIYYEPYEVIE